MGCWLGFCGGGVLCVGEGWRFCLGLVAGWVLLCECLVFGVGVGWGVLMVAACACLMSVLLARVCLRMWWLVCAGGCGRVGWCVAGRRARVHVACARSHGAQTFFWG